MTSFSARRQFVRTVELEEAPGGFPNSQLITSLERHWSGRRTGTALPARADFRFEEMRQWIGQISLVDVQQAPLRFRWRLIGSTIVNWMGRDSTGKWFDEIYDSTWLPVYEAAYTTSVRRQAPAYFAGNLEFVGKDFLRFKSVHLPLADDGTTVNMLLLCLDFEPIPRATL